MTDRDTVYRELFLDAVRVCARYRPAFGTAKGDVEITLNVFRDLYGADPLYRWIGLDSPLMYAAHKAAGGMTSIYRQIGIGCERLIRTIIRDELRLADDAVIWSYVAERSDGKIQRMTLDARIDRRDIAGRQTVERFGDWLDAAAGYVGWRAPLDGAVFEVRQGYKSADSKRQNADLRYGLAAYNAGYLPVVFVVSTQVSQTVIDRYRRSNLLVLTGTADPDPTQSSFAFMEQVIGYSLADFFHRNAPAIRGEMGAILNRLLSPV